ncbi:LOW QUALITY PROTEIN: solute carrier family 2 member 9, like 1 [Boleophthalmus pectinirostris]|uniref:LOW QUALITY PROTEIN: solute carrier family 2 member 9, like 1 n=1 Tax=Boleophthalmus pectinirostris TaxID=150288 RepID=UPI0024302A1D|nr:LOW QUALITY PROTEIN: solute carrier family 2 member 9, like 1 [Boleophthalmus pectinirostris]
MDTFLQQLTRGNAVYLIIVLGVGGSFHLGYHITGLSSPSPFIQTFINSSWFNRYGEVPPPHTCTMIWSLIVSMFALGGLLGVLSIRFISSKLGRKKAMMCSNCIAIVAAIVILTSKMLESFEMVIVARVLHGFSAGLSSCIQTMYLGEISPRKFRGMVAFTSFTFSSLGKLSGQFFGLSEIMGREDLWNVLLCVPACLSVLNILLLPFFPEPPRYLFIEKGDDQACKSALQSLWGPGDYKEEMEDMLVEHAATKAAPPKSPLQLLGSKRTRWALFTLFLLCTCNQMSGISMVSTFSYDLFYKAGMPQENIRYVSLALGATEITTSICCSFLIERIGRRPLFWVGYSVMAVSWASVSVTVYFQDSADWVPYLTFLFVIAVIVFFCGGPGGGVPTLNTEIFIQSERMAAVVLVALYRWATYAIMGLIFPFLIVALRSYCYVLFGCWCVVGGLYSFFILPETKGKTILEISEKFGTISVCGKSSTTDHEVYETVF